MMRNVIHQVVHLSKDSQETIMSAIEASIQMEYSVLAARNQPQSQARSFSFAQLKVICSIPANLQLMLKRELSFRAGL